LFSEQGKEENGLNGGECGIAKCKENWVKLSIHNSKVKELLVEGAYGFNGSIYNIPPKEVVRMIAFMGILLVLFVMLKTL